MHKTSTPPTYCELLASLVAVLPYARSRAEDMHESGGDDCAAWKKANAAVEAAELVLLSVDLPVLRSALLVSERHRGTHADLMTQARNARADGAQHARLLDLARSSRVYFGHFRALGN